MAIGIGHALSSFLGQLIAPRVPTWSSLSGKQLNSSLRSEEAFKQLVYLIGLAAVFAPLGRQTVTKAFVNALQPASGNSGPYATYPSRS